MSRSQTAAARIELGRSVGGGFAPPAPRNADQLTVTASFGFTFLFWYLFFAWGRIPELIAIQTGWAPPIMPVLMIGALIVSAPSSGLWRFLDNRALQLAVLYYLWVLITIPFSIWRGGSIPYVLYELKTATLLIAILSLVRSIGQIRRLMLALALSMLVLIVFGSSVSASDNTRFQFEAGSLANPNELANHLLIGLPLCWALGIGKPVISWANAVRWIVLLVSVGMLAKTGSRGGIVIAGGMTLLLLITLSLKNKIKLLFAASALLLMATAVAPQLMLQRYKTITSGEGVPDAVGEAIESRASREELLRASVRITLRHPVFGVGPANFGVAYNDMRHQEGYVNYHWEATHNAYTQISSESGIPALLFYLAAFTVALKRLLSVRAQARKIGQLAEIYTVSSLLLLSTAAYLLSGFFTSNAHQFYFPLLLALTIAVDRFGREQIAAVQAGSQVPAAWMQSKGAEAGSTASPGGTVSAGPRRPAGSRLRFRT